MNNFINFLFLLFICVANLYAQEKGMYEAADAYMTQAYEIHDDFNKRYNLTKQAADIYEDGGAEEKFLEAQLEVTRSAFYLGDSVLYEQEYPAYIDMAKKLNDTLHMVTAYNNRGIFYFSHGDKEKSTNALLLVDKLNLYSKNSVEKNVQNLSGLISNYLNSDSDFESAFYYIDKLDEIAHLYNNSDAIVSSKLQQSYLYSKSLNFKESLNALRSAYPYIKDSSDKGQLYFFYSGVVNSFTEEGLLDSAEYYLNVMNEVALYPGGDPRNCYTILATARLKVLGGNSDIFTDAYYECYDQKTRVLAEGKTASLVALSALYSNSKARFIDKDWKKLDKILPLFIKSAIEAKNNKYSKLAYEIQYNTFIQRGQVELASTALSQYKKYGDLINEGVIRQSEDILNKQMSLRLAKENNRLLEIENQNQKLLLQRNRNYLTVSVLLLLGLLGVITYYRKLSKFRADQSDKLDKLVKSRTSELEQSNQELVTTNEKLSSSNVELERFAYIASHDLQEPIKTIIGFSNVLEKKVKVEDKSVTKSITYMRDVAHHMQHLIEDILNYSKAHSNGKEIQSINLNELLDEIKYSLVHLIKSKNAEIRYQNLPTIYGIRVPLLLVFKNIIENGIKYNNASQPVVEIVAQEYPDKYRFEIRDNGIGIAQEDQEKVFEIFKRLHNRKDISGTGIGLAMVKKLLNQMGQTLELKSKPDEGTSFFFSYPKDNVAENRA